MKNEVTVKGACGNWKYGYIARKGERNLWVVITPVGDVFQATQNNCQSAYQDALYQHRYQAA
jgi:hypothetical protein